MNVGVRTFTFDFTTSSSVSPYSVDVPLIDDTALELTETFSVSLSFSGEAPTGISIVPATAQISILDDDGEWSLHGETACFLVIQQTAILPINIHIAML